MGREERREGKGGRPSRRNGQWPRADACVVLRYNRTAASVGALRLSRRGTGTEVGWGVETAPRADATSSASSAKFNLGGLKRSAPFRSCPALARGVSGVD
jgi:hypothetical protein